MKVKEALQIVRRACEVFRGVWQEHITLQQALKVLEDENAKKTVGRKAKKK